MTLFLQNVVNALQWGSFYALIALGYSMVYGVLMLFNFAHGDIFMVGAYIGFGVATALLAVLSLGSLALPGWLVLTLTIVLSMILTAMVGMLVERVGYRPLRSAPRASAAITGLMIGIILETGNLALFGARRVSFPNIIETKTYELGGVFITNKKIMIVLISVAMMLALHQFVQRTKWGMAMRAKPNDPRVIPNQRRVDADLAQGVGHGRAARQCRSHGVLNRGAGKHVVPSQEESRFGPASRHLGVHLLIERCQRGRTPLDPIRPGTAGEKPLAIGKPIGLTAGYFDRFGPLESCDRAIVEAPSRIEQLCIAVGTQLDGDSAERWVMGVFRTEVI